MTTPQASHSPAALDALLHRRLRDNAEAVAFVHEGHVTRHAAFEQVVRDTTAWLQSRGIGRHDKVAVWAANGVTWLALLFALSRLGAALVAVNTRYRSEEVGYLLSRSKARLLLVQPD